MSDIKEFKVDSRDYFSRSMFLVKEFLKNNKKIKIVGSTNNAVQATRVAESLRRFGYVEFDDIQTETLVSDGRRQTRLAITVHNTPDFDKLYKESEEARKKKEEEKKKRNEERKKDETKKDETKKEETKK